MLCLTSHYDKRIITVTYRIGARCLQCISSLYFLLTCFDVLPLTVHKIYTLAFSTFLQLAFLYRKSESNDRLHQVSYIGSVIYKVRARMCVCVCVLGEDFGLLR
jgi:hypothetical protein